MHTLQRMNDTRRDERFYLSLLVLATGFAMTMHNPQAQESLSALVSSIELPTHIEQVSEMRPQTPPPFIEADSLMTDEASDVQPMARERDRDHIRIIDLRTTPER